MNWRCMYGCRCLKYSKRKSVFAEVTGRGRKAKKKTKPLAPQGPSRYTEYSPPNTAPTQPRPKIP